MRNIDQILDLLESEPAHQVSSPKGLPELPEGFSLPADVVKFYERFGESILNEESETGAWARVVTPEEFNRIDAAIMGGERFASGPFENWFALVDVEDGNYIAIDLSVEHQGKCLDAFHETFAIPSYVDVVAASFTDLLNRFPVSYTHLTLPTTPYV